MKNLLKNQKGFTLIELMVVVFIVAILAALAIPSYFRNVQKARATEAQTALRAMSTAYETYKMQYGSVENYEKEDALKDAGIRESVSKKWEFEPNLNGSKLISVTAISTGEFDGGEGHEIVFDVEEGTFSGWGIDQFSGDDDGE